MKYLGRIKDKKDLITKEYCDSSVSAVKNELSQAIQEEKTDRISDISTVNIELVKKQEKAIFDSSSGVLILK